MKNDTPSSVAGYDQIEAELEAFEAAERRKLGLDEAPIDHWVDANPQTFTSAQRGHTTILFGGLTLAHDQLVRAALSGLGYDMQPLDVPDNESLRFGKEFGNRAQCNPTYFTVGNLVKHLIHLRDREGMAVEEIIRTRVFFTAGACGPCRFGTYVTEYRKALRDAGFDGFRVLLFQQQGGLAPGDRRGCGTRVHAAVLHHAAQGAPRGRRAESDRLSDSALRARTGLDGSRARGLQGTDLRRVPAARQCGPGVVAIAPQACPGAREPPPAQAEGLDHRRVLGDDDGG